jgi:hypothetical protein
VVGNVEIMEPTSAIALRSAKDDDVDSQISTNVAATRFPRTILERLAIVSSAVFAAVVNLVVFVQQLQQSAKPSPPRVVCVQSCEARPFKSAGLVLVNLAGADLAGQPRIALDLGDANCRIAVTERVVVLTVVLEGLIAPLQFAASVIPTFSALEGRAEGLFQMQSRWQVTSPAYGDSTQSAGPLAHSSSVPAESHCCNLTRR